MDTTEPFRLICIATFTKSISAIKPSAKGKFGRRLRVLAFSAVDYSYFSNVPNVSNISCLFNGNIRGMDSHGGIAGPGGCRPKKGGKGTRGGCRTPTAGN